MSVRDTWWHINPGDVVIDAGAAYGSYALAALAMGASRVIAWTPEEHLELAANIHLNNWQDRADIWNNGLWSETGWLAIWPYAPKPQFFREKPVTMPEGATALFPVICMDDALGAGPGAPDRVDWLKMDVEGCEVEVLRGAQALVRRFTPKILVENHLFKDAEIKNKFGELLRQINPVYKEIGTMPYASVSHTLWSI
jgi:FkbM family methyltransferase